MNSTLPISSSITIGDYLPIGSFTIHSRFKRVVNFVNNSSQIAFVTNEVNNLAFNGIYIKNVDISDIESFTVEKDFIEINGQQFLSERLEIYDSTFSYKEINVNEFEARLVNAVELYPELFSNKSLAFLIQPERETYFESGFDFHFMQNAKNGVGKIIYGDIIGGVKTIKGTGYGLTPAGDDFVAGMLWGLHYLAETNGVNLDKLINDVFEAAKGKNELVNSFLLQAKLGYYFYSFKKYLSLSVQNLDSFDTLNELLSLGATSGADMLSGYIFTIKHKVGI